MLTAKRKVWLILAFAAVLALPGCVSMKSVQDYAAASHETLVGVGTVGKDFGDTCDRANKYIPYNQYNDCAAEKAKAQGIQAAAKVLDAYMLALGALAADELVVYDKELDGLAKAVKDAGIMPAAKADAVARVAAFVAKGLTSIYQQNKVAEYLTRGNDDLGNATEGLSVIIGENYPIAVNNELVFWGKRFKAVEATERSNHPLDWDSHLAAQWQVRSDLQAKVAAAKALAECVKAMGQAHAALKNDAQRLTGKELFAVVRDYVAAAKPVVKEVQDAFNRK